MLKYIIAALADAPAEHQALYKETTLDGKQVFQLQVEGAVPAKKLEEFRDNNRTLNGELAAFKALGHTPEQLKELVDKKADFENGNLVTKGKLDEVRVNVETALKKTHETEKTALQTTIAQQTQQISHLLITQESQRVAAELGFRTAALPDVGMYAERVFKIEDGKPVAIDPTTGKQMVGADGYSPLTMKEYIERVAKDKPYMLEESKGGGAGGSGGKPSPGRSNKPNPFKKDSFSRTEQSQLYKSNYPEYERMAREAGATPIPPPQK